MLKVEPQTSLFVSSFVSYPFNCLSEFPLTETSLHLRLSDVMLTFNLSNCRGSGLRNVALARSLWPRSLHRFINIANLPPHCQPIWLLFWKVLRVLE